jgi:hypothetical protein
MVHTETPPLLMSGRWYSNGWIIRYVQDSHELLCTDMPVEHLHVGTTIFMQEEEYSIIRNKVASDGNQRGLLFVTNFDYDPAPEQALKPENIENGNERSEVTPDFATAWISVQAIKRVKEEAVFLFMDSFQHEEGFFYWMFCLRATRDGVCIGIMR